MEVGSLVLLHSPMLRGPVLSAFAAELVGRGIAVTVPDIGDDDQRPYAMRYVARATLSINRAGPPQPLVLVGHGDAGPLLPQVATALRAGSRRVAGYVFCDATLPRPNASRMALLEAEDPGRARTLHERLHDGGEFTTWPDAELARLGDPAIAAAVTGWVRPRGHEFYVEPLPMPQDWPDAPCGYLQLSDERPTLARTARSRGWPVLRRDVGHFGVWSEPAEVADSLLELLHQM